MHRVLIVDDEEPVLDSYAFMLENECPDFALVGKGRSGYQALQLIHELKPDVVFMDINIPGIDGIEVIEDVHHKFPGTVFIVSTAYERFDLAQRAIPLGIFAYLVKPVTKKVFLETLDAVGSALERRAPTLPLRNTDYAERQFLNESIWKRMNPEDWSNYRRLFSFHSDKGIVCLLELEEDQLRWCKEVAAKISFRHRCLFSLHLNRGLYFIPEDVDRDALLAYTSEILRACLPERMFRAFAVGFVHAGAELYLSCDEALEELRKKKSHVDVQLRERLRIVQIRRKIGIFEIEEVRGIFSALWEETFSFYDLPEAKAKMVALFVLLIDDCMGCFSGDSEEEPPLAPAEEIMPIDDVAGWAAWADPAFNKIFKVFELRRSRKFPVPLVKAIDFIGGHFNEQLQLGTAAEAAQVSGAYLSRLFTEHLRTTFIDYLTELRVGKAELLIRDSRMSMKEVAFAVGYQDPNYFSKIFRKATGLPPTIYAAENRTGTIAAIEEEGL